MSMIAARHHHSRHNLVEDNNDDDSSRKSEKNNNISIAIPIISMSQSDAFFAMQCEQIANASTFVSLSNELIMSLVREMAADDYCLENNNATIIMMMTDDTHLAQHFDAIWMTNGMSTAWNIRKKKSKIRSTQRDTWRVSVWVCEMQWRNRLPRNSNNNNLSVDRVVDLASTNFNCNNFFFLRFVVFCKLINIYFRFSFIISSSINYNSVFALCHSLGQLFACCLNAK